MPLRTFINIYYNNCRQLPRIKFQLKKKSALSRAQYIFSATCWSEWQFYSDLRSLLRVQYSHLLFTVERSVCALPIRCLFIFQIKPKSETTAADERENAPRHNWKCVAFNSLAELFTHRDFLPPPKHFSALERYRTTKSHSIATEKRNKMYNKNN